MEIPIRFSIRSLADEGRPMFMMLSLSNQPRLPVFVEVDKGKIGSVEKVNSFINERGVGEEDRTDFLGVPSKGEDKNISIFKSYLNRKLYLFVFVIADIKKSFSESNWNFCKLIETKNDFEATLRKVY